MPKLSNKEFDKLYQQCVDEIWPFWNNKMQAEIAEHCAGWAPGRIDFQGYLRLSSIRFYKAYCHLYESGGRSLCDVGGFWGVWPMTAKRLGYDVAMTESLRFYGRSFNKLFEHVRSSGVEIFDHNPFAKGAVLRRRFDLVTAMAVMEHYPNSLRTFLENIRAMIKDGGSAYLEVPNIAYWPKRVGLLRGDTPLASIEDIYNSDEPFIGHHHEFTMAELRDLARLGGFKIVAEDFVNYTVDRNSKLVMWLRHPLMSAAFLLSKESRECISILCQPV